MAQFSNSRPRYSTGKRRRSTRTRRAASAGPAPARRRGPAPIIIIAAVIILLIFCWIVGRGCGGNMEAKENEKLREYTASANKLINKSAAAGQQFQSVKAEVKNLARDDVANRLQQITDSCKDIARSCSQIKAPEKAKGLQPLLQLTMDLRASGLDQYKTALLDVLDDKAVDQAQAVMANGLMDLVVSDRSMQRFRGGLEEKLKAAKFGFEKVSDSVYLPKTDEALASGVNEYIAALTGEEAGDALHGVAVVGLSTTPARVDKTESGVSILPYSKTFSVKVTVQNQGNQEEDNVPVVVTMTLDPEGTQQKKTQKIVRLKAGETQTLVFEDLLPATGSEKQNMLRVTAGPVNHEQKTDNNTMELNFIMRPETG